MQLNYVLYENPQYRVILTGFNNPSKNRKTGAMIQCWIIPRQPPWHNSGTQKIVCLDCPLQPVTGSGECYVNFVALINIYKSLKNNLILHVLHRFWNVPTRWGAWGEPVLIPYFLLKRFWRPGDTGYTHQWKNPLYQNYKKFLMASVESKEDAFIAQMMGWRTYRITDDPTDRSKNEAHCPHTITGLQCIDCGYCGGVGTGNVVVKKILKH